MQRRTALVGISVGVAAALLSAGTGAAAGSPGTHAALAATPKLAVTISKKHFTVSGPKTFEAGRVAISLTAVGAEGSLQVASFTKGYTFKDLRADLTTYGKGSGTGPDGSTPKSAIKALDHALKHTTLYGGFDSLPGKPEKGTVVLPKAGSYLIYNDSGNLPADPTKLTVTGSEVKRAAPDSSATVTGLTNRRFGGATTLPAKGTITFANKSTESPHLLVMLHVKNGTTKKQVLAGLESSSGGPPAFILKGQVQTDAISEGLSQTVSYNEPKGEYAELCFFPDPKTGMPHAFMGMIRIVHLT